MNKTHDKEPPLKRYVVRKRTMFSLLVPILFVIFARPTSISLAAGGTVVILGELIRIWAAGCIDKNAKLACRGPFAYLRNPLYFGSLFIALGYCLMSGLWWSWFITAAMYYVFYVGTIDAEEEHLRAVLGEPYARYCQAVPRLLPRLSPFTDCDGPAFSWTMVRINREWQSIVGVVVFVLAFVCIWLLPAHQLFAGR